MLQIKVQIIFHTKKRNKFISNVINLSLSYKMHFGMCFLFLMYKFCSFVQTDASNACSVCSAFFKSEKKIRKLGILCDHDACFLVIIYHQGYQQFSLVVNYIPLNFDTC